MQSCDSFSRYQGVACLPVSYSLGCMICIHRAMELNKAYREQSLRQAHLCSAGQT